MKTSRLLFILFALVNFHCHKDASYTSVGTDEKPNIIFLLADDMRYDALGCTGNQFAVTPNLDDLAAKGTNFKNSYVTSAICAISRASIFTGQYERRHGIDNFDKNLAGNALAQSYPLLLKQYGYYTGFIGKFGVGTNMPSNSFDFWRGFPGHGAYFYRDSAGTLVHETEFKERQAQQFIEGRDRSKPFCLSISFKAPHSEDETTENNGFRPDPFFNSWYSSIQFPYPDTYANQYYNKFPPLWRTNQQGVINEARTRWNLRFSTPAKFQATYHAIYRLVSGVDKAVGELRQYLAANGVEKNTIIVFTADHGDGYAGHSWNQKQILYEEASKVPFIIAKMGEWKPRTDDMLVCNGTDIIPTICGLAGIAKPKYLKGLDISKKLDNPVQNLRDTLVIETDFADNEELLGISGRAVITKDFKYIVYNKGEIKEQLFDLTKDPGEMNNLAVDYKYKKKLTTMRTYLKQWCKTNGDKFTAGL